MLLYFLFISGPAFGQEQIICVIGVAADAKKVDLVDLNEALNPMQGADHR